MTGKHKMEYTRPAEDSKTQENKRFNKDKENNQKRLKKLQEMANGKDKKELRQEKAQQEKLQLYTRPNEIKTLLEQGKNNLKQKNKRRLKKGRKNNVQ